MDNKIEHAAKFTQCFGEHFVVTGVSMHAVLSSRRKALLLVSLLSATLLTGLAHAATWRFAVPPFLPQAEMQKQYAPLVDYLNQSTGETFQLVTSPSYLSYWDNAKKSGAYDLVIDSAPMIDFRIQRQGFKVLAKIEGVISMSVVTGEKTAIFEVNELIGKKMAVIASPNISALAMFKMFTNPMRQPDFIYADDARAAAEMVLKGKVLAAIIPTPIAIQFPELNIVSSTEQIPHLAVAAAPSLPPAIQAKVQKALLEANKSELGKKALATLNTPGFEMAHNYQYSGYGKWLEGTFGY